MADHTGDWWDRLPAYVKIFIAVSIIWTASATSTLLAQRYSDVPNRIDDHEDRITVLEGNQESSQMRTTSHFVYIGCMLQEIREGTSGSRCELVLSAEDQELLKALRR